MNDNFIPCSIPSLPDDQLVAAAQIACDYNPANRPPPEAMMAASQFFYTALVGFVPGDSAIETAILTPGHLAVLTSRYWGSAGVKLTVGFMETATTELKNKILAYANEWSKHANIQYVLSNTDPQVRITRSGDGYWSYLGTDILSIPRNQPTMSLQNFTMATPDSEFMRVVPHEFGHTNGFPHEHMRRELVDRLDPQKTLVYFQRTQGWSAAMTRQQVLTALDEASIRMPNIGNTIADQDSIMCYNLPGSITIDGQPIRGGNKIDEIDAQYANKLYPKAEAPKPPTVKRKRITFIFDDEFAAVEKFESL